MSIIAEPLKLEGRSSFRGDRHATERRYVFGEARLMRPVGRGNTGKQVVDIQTRLAALGYFLGDEGADGFFGPHTESAIRAFQQQRLLFSDGVVEDNTWTELVEAGYQPGDRLLYLRVPYMRGDDVLFLQRRLDELGFDCGPVDGIFSPQLEVAVTEFQRNAGLNVDGIVGETTVDRLRRLHKVGDDERAVNIPDRMNGYVGLKSIPGLRVSVDPAHGGRDRGFQGPNGTTEKDANLALGLKLAELLRDAGADVLLLRETDVYVPLYERTDAANVWEPHMHICLHHASAGDPKARGSTSYYFANSVYLSRGGKRLAGYLVDALSRELGRVDLQKHGRNYACLREVKPLAVVVEPGFLSNPEEGRQLFQPEVVTREAQAILHGIEAYLARL
jgi:N-acetylmuramoyl-L-alanine amidase